jgi:hypothetical protein
LEHDPDPGPPVLASPSRVNSEDRDFTVRPHPEPLEDLDGGGLAGTVRPEERHDFTTSDVEIDPIENVERPVSHTKADDLN